jgi:hypothetical protein
MFGQRLYELPVHQGEGTFHGSSVSNGPLYSALVNRVVWALGLTGAAIDAFIGNLDGHDGKFIKRGMTNFVLQI